ncbi:MAG: sigma-70 family RNA polymerase sigma factor [Vicinamibacterales bacterium]
MEQAEAQATDRAMPADFETLFRLNYAQVARAVARIIGDPARAEELAVEAFWRLSRRPEAQTGQGGGWAYRTAVRLALDELRRRARRERYERLFSAVRSAPRRPDSLFFAAEQQGRVRTVLACLAARDAELLVLRSAELSYDELAAALVVSPTSIGTLLARARGAFRKEYVKRYGTPGTL